MLALFAASAAEAATDVQPADGTQADGTQAASRCPEPKMGKLPKQRKVGERFNVKASGVTQGTEWLLRIDGRDRAAGTADASGRIKHEVKMVDFGLAARKVEVDLVLANEACENSPWKLTRKVGYAGRFDGKPAPTESQPGETAAPAPGAAAPAPAATTPSRSPVIPKPVKPKFKPLQAPANALQAPAGGRVWVTPTDVTVHSTSKPKNPKLPRAELKIDSAQSTSALVGLGILFVLIAIATGVGLYLLNRKDTAADVAVEEGRLPTHLDTSDIGNLSLSEAGEAVVRQGVPPKSLLEADATAPVLGEEAPGPHHVASQPGDVPVPVAGAEAPDEPLPPPVESVGAENINAFLEESEPTPAEVPSAAEPHPAPATAGALAEAAAVVGSETSGEPAPGQTVPNGNGATGHSAPAGEEAPRGQFEQIVEATLDDAGVQQELRSIVAEARDGALRQGVPVDRDGIIAELDRVTSATHLSGPARDKLMSRFQQIVSEELERVPQAH